MSDSDDVISGDSSVGDGGWQEQQQYLVNKELVMLPQQYLVKKEFMTLPRENVQNTNHLFGNRWKITVSIILC